MSCCVRLVVQLGSYRVSWNATVHYHMRGCNWCKIGPQDMSEIEAPMVTAHTNHFFNRARLRVVRRKLCTLLISTMTVSLAALASLPTGAFAFSLFHTCYFLNSPLCFFRWWRRLWCSETTSALLSSPPLPPAPPPSLAFLPCL